MDLKRFPRFKFSHNPTPLEPLANLSKYLGGPEIWIKRDDCTGLATGGNKTRKLEFLVGDALEKKANILVTQGAVQSNHARQTAAAACKSNLKCHLLLHKWVPYNHEIYEETSNILIDRMLGAKIEFRPTGLDMNEEVQILCEKLSSNGFNPYYIPGGGSNEVGALGYVDCALELKNQMKSFSLSFDFLIHATGSAGTQAGLITGLAGSNTEINVLGICVHQSKSKQISAVHKLINELTKKLDIKNVKKDLVNADDNYIGEGYGIPNQSTKEALKILAETEGILLDPVYSGKSMAGLIDYIRRGNFKKGQRILYLHTGGTTALFAYNKLIF